MMKKENSELISEKIKLVAKSYNDYIYKYSCFEKGKQFSGIKKVKKHDNYFAEIMNYLLDTLPMVKVADQGNDIDSNIFHHIGLLQIIYVQQDLMGEMLKIFGCPEGNSGKEMNRKLRNELIGHPVSTPRNDEKNKYDDIKSTVLWNLVKTTNKTICYTRYSFEKNNHHVETISVDLSEVINRHNAYLNKNLDIILGKIKSDFLPMMVNNIRVLECKWDNFEALAHLANQYFDLAENEILFSSEWLMKFKRMENDHPRYKFVCGYFKLSLNKAIEEKNRAIDCVIDDINQILEGNIEHRVQSIPISVMCHNLKFGASDQYSEKRKDIDNTYCLSPLLQKDRYIDSISFNVLKAHYRDNEDVMSELRYMECNMADDMEYNAAYNFLYHCLIFSEEFENHYSINPRQIIK